MALNLKERMRIVYGFGRKYDAARPRKNPEIDVLQGGRGEMDLRIYSVRYRAVVLGNGQPCWEFVSAKPYK